ncbi:MAG: hypothetical protein AAF363_01395 [Bacteroidota bacterium]
MKALKRVEIICGAIESKKLMEVIEEQELRGYTMIRNVQGLGSRGIQDADGLHDGFQNVMIILGISNEEFEQIKEPLRKFLKRSGGVCMVSDAEWLMH